MRARGEESGWMRIAIVKFYYAIQFAMKCFPSLKIHHRTVISGCIATSIFGLKKVYAFLLKEIRTEISSRNFLNYFFSGTSQVTNKHEEWKFNKIRIGLRCHLFVKIDFFGRWWHFQQCKVRLQTLDSLHRL